MHPKIVGERLGHASVGITLDTYFHGLPGLQEIAAKAFDEVLARQPAKRAAKPEETQCVPQMFPSGGLLAEGRV